MKMMLAIAATLAVLPGIAAHGANGTGECRRQALQRPDPTQFACQLAAAQAGDLEAMFEVAVNYRHGDGTEKDLTQAAHWYLEAAQRGHPIAMFSLIRIYRLGEGVPKDAGEAFRWALKSANGGNVVAMGEVVRDYRLGEGVSQNASEAGRWLQRYDAAAPGSPDPAGSTEALTGYWQKVGTSAAADAEAASEDAERHSR